jgi:hypothetical protein
VAITLLRNPDAWYIVSNDISWNGGPKPAGYEEAYYGVGAIIFGVIFGIVTIVMMPFNIRKMITVGKNRRAYKRAKKEYEEVKWIPDYNPSVYYDGKPQKKEAKKVDNAVTAPPQTAETEKERVMAARRAQNVCQYCGSPFDNTPDKKCTKCGWKKDY